MSDLRGKLDVAPSGLDAIFRPRSVAVIGAGREATSMSGRLFRNLLASFRGPVFPINPKAAEIGGARTFASIRDVPDAVDLAFIVVPAASVLEAVRQCIDKGVRGLVVITAGYSEINDAGRQQQRELLDLVRSAGLRMIGPNCFGVFNTDPAVQLQGTFAAGAAPRGNIAIGSQSGALGLAIPEYLRQWHLGASTFASVGNKADVNENDLLDYWRNDPATDVVLLYLESFADPREFRWLASELSREKPIVALKAGCTQAGARAASSHTAALASPDRAADALFAQCGVLRVHTLQEMFDVTSLFASQPPPRGRRVAILTNAGGPAILCADALAARGLALPEFSPQLQAALRSFLRPEASVRNPIDLIGTIDAREFRRCLELLMDSDEVDSVITMYVPREPGTSAAVAQAIREVTAARGRGKTSVAVFTQTEGLPNELHDETTHIPGYLFPESAATALACGVAWAERRSRQLGTVVSFPDIDVEKCRRLVDAALARGSADGVWLSADEVERLLACAGLSRPRSIVARTADEAAAIATEWQCPVVLKVVSPTVLHKTDVGGVVVDVQGEAAVRAAFQQVTSVAADARGALVQEFVASGHETLIGVTRDPQFGHLITFGLGGVLVELLNDVACRMAPLTDRDADDMLGSLRTSAVLTGYRNRPAADVVGLRETLLRTSALVTLVPEIAECDLNPVKALPPGRGVCVVDARVRVRRD